MNWISLRLKSVLYKRILIFFKRYYKETPRAAMCIYSLKVFFWFKDSIIFSVVQLLRLKPSRGHCCLGGLINDHQMKYFWQDTLWLIPWANVFYGFCHSGQLLELKQPPVIPMQIETSVASLLKTDEKWCPFHHFTLYLVLLP